MYRVRFSLVKKSKAFQKRYMKVGAKKLLGAGVVPARTWRLHAARMAPTERFKLRRQMAAAAGKQSTTSLSLFIEAFGLEVEEDLSTLATAPEVQTWRVLCETRDLGIKWPHWHTLISEGNVRNDMRYVCPKDVKKMLVQQARSTYWKKWEAKHEYEELNEGIWLEPSLAVLRKKTNEEWTEKH